MSVERVLVGVLAGFVALLIGFEIGAAIYTLEPSSVFLPATVFEGAFPGLRARLRTLAPATA